MRRLTTKEDRMKSRQAQFESLIKYGYTKEDYQDMVIFTKDEAGRFFMQIFTGTASHSVSNYWYRSAESRAEALQRMKESHDRRIKYKEERKKNKTLTGHAAAAKAIREELKKVFPDVVFSVRSESFSMGDAVRIKWEDGPTSEMVEEITGKYQYGHFDGMEDMYVSSNRRNDIPQAKYVTESRTMSKETGEAIKEDAQRIFDEFSYNCHNVENFIYRVFNASPIPGGVKVLGLEKTGETSGICEPERFYRIKHSAPQQIEKPQPVEVQPGKVQVIEYSPKAVAVIGDTKPIKDKLKALGGRFNFRLSCGAGWIFPINKLEALKTALSA